MSSDSSRSRHEGSDGASSRDSSACCPKHIVVAGRGCSWSALRVRFPYESFGASYKAMAIVFSYMSVQYSCKYKESSYKLINDGLFPGVTAKE
ncbi:hypothetical protein L7F22_062847, partial [Adiantum nelumboides]|nr:hypothetical protein [Adiantum nelumboides]